LINSPYYHLNLILNKLDNYKKKFEISSSSLYSLQSKYNDLEQNYTDLQSRFDSCQSNSTTYLNNYHSLSKKLRSDDDYFYNKSFLDFFNILKEKLTFVNENLIEYKNSNNINDDNFYLKNYYINSFIYILLLILYNDY